MRTVHQLSVQFGGPGFDLTHRQLAARFLAHVKTQVHLIGIHPAGVSQIERHEGQFAVKDGREVDAFGQMLRHGLVETALEAFGQLVQMQ